MIAVTGANGQLGQRVIKYLLAFMPAEEIVAMVRNLDHAQPLQALGVKVRHGDYTQPETLIAAMQGVDKLLLISSSEVGQRVIQHQNVIDAAQTVGIQLLAYTSILHAPTSPLALAEEHRATEAYLKESNLPYILLRNGWYSENYLQSVAPAMANGGFIGSAGEGKISSASRDDYALAAAVVLTRLAPQHGKVYELAGDESYTLTELCDIVSDYSGQKLPYLNLEEGEFVEALEKAGLPHALALMLANSDIGAAQQGLFDDSEQLSTLIGRPTQTLRQLVPHYL